ncbi:rhomboid family intramembrane serine protease [Aquimarina sp. RZ0]|uniref:rhomboid family intramembrane serine protease n=1 Tax=Aquimarina sp. RZ0 TaxID=2607730 RepID=UPI0011F15829|nr:rhomboid family intramembrane serine protease [Aquimarina sp. RZ0]KAA1246456.1 rhomboid family intramembrane serine protease [Aquimarina sp. RZ0]
MGRITDTVKTLLIINVIFFIGSLTLGDVAYRLFALWFPKNDNFQIWQVVTHMFMHSQSTFTHILFNMFMLYMFGSHLETSIGQKKFLFLYFSSGFGAMLLQLVFYYVQFQPAYQSFIEAGFTNEEVIGFLKSGEYSTAVLQYTSEESVSNMFGAYRSLMVGASGAISGIIVAFAVLYPNLPLYLMFIPIPIKAKYLVAAYFAMDLFGGITGQSIMGPSNVAHWAHIGGAVIGFITMWYWKKNSFNQNRWN